MAVTAAVWEEAHTYHSKRLQFHAMLHHEPGIVTGLEVIGSDPPDSSLYILPGIAVDPHGQIVVLPEPMAYDLGTAQGLLYLLLTYEESSPLAEGDGEDEPRYVYAHFGIEAVSTLPNAPHVELARIRRRSGEAPIVDAVEAENPAGDEIDQRFRQTIGHRSRDVVSLAVSYTGGASARDHGRGIRNLARALRRSGLRAFVEDGVSLAAGLEGHTLVCLVGQDAFQLSADEMNVLYAYLQEGGTVLIESCRRGINDDAPPADVSFGDMLASMGVKTEALPAGHSLLVDPFLFAAPPPGFETEGETQLLVGGGVILSTSDYGCLWQGLRRDGPATREEIRTAMEWGSNIVAYALGRRTQGNSGSRGA
jgi:hypothetical protein